MSIEAFIVDYFDKPYEQCSLGELRAAPVEALSGVTKQDAANLKKAFGIKTVSDFATHPYVLIAQAINVFSRHSRKILDKEFESSEIEELRDKPVSAIAGVSVGDAKLLKEAFGITSIGDLAENKYVRIAQLATIPVSLMELMQPPKP